MVPLIGDINRAIRRYGEAFCINQEILRRAVINKRQLREFSGCDVGDLTLIAGNLGAGVISAIRQCEQTRAVRRHPKAGQTAKIRILAGPTILALQHQFGRPQRSAA